MLQQVLDVGPLIRRGRTVAGSTGVWAAIIRVTDSLGPESFDPYNVIANVAPGGGFPMPVPTGFDVWVLNASLRTSGAITGGHAVEVILRDAGVAFSQGLPGPAPTSITTYPWYWHAPTAAGMQIPAISSPPLRIRRGSMVSCSSGASGTQTADFRFLLGVFPAGLGQDVIGGY